MERPVGDKFKINGCVYVVVEDSWLEQSLPCKKCAFDGIACASVCDIRGRCVGDLREDGVSVHFEHFGVDF